MNSPPDAQEQQIVRWWNTNARPWTEAIRADSIASRTAGAPAAGWHSTHSKIWRVLAVVCCLGMSGCVLGYGHCLFTEPVRNTLAGRVHFRDYPAPDGIDNVPILALDNTAYVYSPAQSHICLPVNDVQMVGVVQFPKEIIEATHVSVEGSLFAASSGRQHTNFVMKVNTILPIRRPH
ncbi:MAG: hypothetical protein M3N50_10835 [Pseudomonadota bacterium]|nr:hypothetical protein [Pseudomonadota bacterium]